MEGSKFKLPEGWKIVKLGEVVEVFDNKRIPLDSEYRLTIKGDFPYCGATGIIDYINDYIFDGEYVLIAEDGGKFNQFEETAYIMKGKFWANNHVHIARGRENILNNFFLMYFINYQDISYYISGSTREKLNQQLLKAIKIPLPPLPEQEKIAEILETVDLAIEKTNRIIEKYKRIKQGLMQELFTKGIDENGKIRDEKTHRFKDSPIGRIPEEWEVVRLGEVLKYEQPYKYIVKDTNYTQTGIPVLTAGKSFILGYTQENEGIYKNLPVIIFDDFTTDSKFVDFPFKVKSSAMKFLKPKNEDINLRFVYEAMQTLKYDYVGGDHKRRWISEFQHFLIPLPPLPEQERIAQTLLQIDKVIEREQKYKQKLESLKRGLMEDLLTGRVRMDKLV